jgi:hypothetical protein
MFLPDEPQPWQCYPADALISVTYEDEVIGYCKPDFAARIVAALNDDERLRQAFKLACYDLVSLSGGNAGPVELVMEKYLDRTKQPRSGTAAIAQLLRDRQDELDVSDREFVRFCDSYRLPKDKLMAIFAGEEIDSSMLTPLSRILGRSIEDLLGLLDDIE